MSGIKRVGDLEISQDLKFHKKELALQRVGWLLMLAIGIAGLLGIFGGGPLSHAQVANDGLQVKYGRFDRILGNSSIQVQVDAQYIQDGKVKVQVDRRFLSWYDVRGILPQPESTKLSPDFITYEFSTGQGEGSLLISFDLEGTVTGLNKGTIGIEGGPSITLSQLMYP